MTENCPVCQEPCESSGKLPLHLIDAHHWSIAEIEAELGELMLGQTHTARILDTVSI